MGLILGLYGRNLILMCAVAGGLHFYFYKKNAQADMLRYDTRTLADKQAQFTFGNQLHDNMFWTLASGVSFWTAYEVLLFWAMANGFAPVMVFAESKALFILMIFLTPCDFIPFLLGASRAALGAFISHLSRFASP